jgi:hypothetical protein
MKSVSVERGITGSEEPKLGASFAYAAASNAGGSAIGCAGATAGVGEGGRKKVRNGCRALDVEAQLESSALESNTQIAAEAAPTTLLDREVARMINVLSILTGT